jgi:N-acetyl-anhydromuramyl-L-alanine amidase AmpD
MAEDARKSKDRLEGEGTQNRLEGEGTLNRLEGEITGCPSPNSEPRPQGTSIDTVVLHATVLDTVAEVFEHFNKPDPGVSAHYTIDRDGTVYQHVEETMKAFHAGVSEMPDGRTGVNDFSIGIELVNRNDGIDTYPSAQLDALRQLLAGIRSRHPIAFVVSHAEIARPPGRKSDPRGLDVSQF